MNVKYYDNDFDFKEYEALQLNNDPKEELLLSNDTLLTSKHNEKLWEKHYFDKGNLFYKQKRYLFKAYYNIFNLYKSSKEMSILDVGVGNGASLFPILNALSDQYENMKIKSTGIDLSQNALDLFEKQDNKKYNTNLVKMDISYEDLQLNHAQDIILLIFSLSAMNFQQHLFVLKQLSNCCKGYILFRDYGIYDMKYNKFKKTLKDNKFTKVNQDDQIYTFFTLEYIEDLIDQIDNLKIIELRYATIITHNRKTKQSIKRVFVHGVFSTLI